MPVEPADFFSVAEMLVAADANELAESETVWIEVEDARARSAVSRGYYASFRYLKHRMILNYPAWTAEPKKFPKYKVHDRLVSALMSTIGVFHPLTVTMKSLLRRRNDCDYQLDPALSCADVEDDLVSAETAIDEIELLTAEQVYDIADKLAQLSQK